MSFGLSAIPTLADQGFPNEEREREGKRELAEKGTKEEEEEEPLPSFTVPASLRRYGRARECCCFVAFRKRKKEREIHQLGKKERKKEGKREKRERMFRL